MSTISKYEFTQLIDIRQIENLLKSYFNATAFTSTILDSEENVLVAVGWQDICTKFHRVNPASCLRCRESGAYIKTHLDAYKEGLVEYKCKNGLWDVAFPIVVAGEHLATFFIGQFFYEDDKIDMDFFRNQAEEFGFNVDEYLEAIKRVPIHNRERVHATMSYHRNLVEIMTENGLKNLKLAQEIEERKRAEKTLFDSDATLRSITTSTRDAIVMIDDQGKVSFWNSAAADMLGWDESEVLGCDLHLILAPQNYYSAYRSGMEHFVRTGKGNAVGKTLELLALCKNKIEIPVELSLSSVKRGGHWHGVGIIRDISERKRAEDKWRSLFNNLPGGSFTVNNNYIIEDVNDVLCAVTGFAREELVGQLCGIICPKGPHLCPIFDLGKERIDNDETAVKGKDGRHVPIIKSARRIPVGNREVIVENFQDITDRKHLEEQLRHAQKMDAIGQLAGGVAHDFNNILTAIIGYGNLLQMKIGKNDPLEKYVNQIIYSAEKAAHLTHSLLAFSRKHVINLKAVMLNEIIYRAEKLLSRLVRENIELRVVAGQDCNVRADSVQIEQIMMNLVTNARDAMPEGGLLLIKTEQVDLDKDFVRSHGYGEPGTYVLISVSDTGFGMDEKIRARIFEPFFTTKETGKGTGLGLAIVYGIIKQHNGYISVYSEPGTGTTFKIYLPVVTADTERVEVFEMTAARSGSETVLLAEDDPTVRGITKSLLEEFGYLVIEAVDGADAVEKFRLNEEVIQLLILDVMMPRKNGKETYNEIKKIQPGVKALFMSGYTDDILSITGVLEENLNFISKPFTQNVLLQKTREVLEKRVDAEIGGALQ